MTTLRTLRPGLPFSPESQFPSFHRIHPDSKVVDYYKEACRALENPDTASLLGRIQKDWKKLVQMKIYYFAAVAHVRMLWLQSLGGAECLSLGSKWRLLLSQLHMGKQAEEQQKFGERVSEIWQGGDARLVGSGPPAVGSGPPTVGSYDVALVLGDF